MLAEAIRYLTTPAPWHLRRLGYLKESIGTEARWQRCRAAWQDHLDACQALIREAAEGSTQRHRVAVLGSGGLHDVPLEDLSRLFGEVLLADVIHPPAVRRRARKLGNVRPITLDASGVAETLFALKPDQPLPAPDASAIAALDADLVISVNLLFQLPVGPCAWLAKRGGRSAAEIEAFGRALVQAHLNALASLRGRVCLITEVEHLLVDRDGKVAERDVPLDDFPLTLAGRSWTWDIAPRREAHPDYDLRYRVVGAIFEGK